MPNPVSHSVPHPGRSSADHRLFEPRQIALQGLLLATGNALIGLLLWVVGFGGSLWVDIVYSECIGLTIYGLASTVFSLTAQRSVLRLVLVPAAIVLGATVGQILGNAITQTSRHLIPKLFSESLFIGLFFGGLGALALMLRERYWDLQTELKAREMKRLEAEKRGAEAQLKLLQAQIEPHFLFNTLANLAGLIEADPKLASRLLESLNRYLRASLKRTRADGGTLGDEMGLLEAYLDVFRIRLGPRLDYTIAVPDPLRALPFPPMLLQPLVENAIRHGIEPQVAGGSIHIAAVHSGGALQVTVRDTGAGLGDAPGSGFGLDNVRARVDALFGASGSLEIVEPPQGGVLATLRLPA